MVYALNRSAQDVREELLSETEVVKSFTKNPPASETERQVLQQARQATMKLRRELSRMENNMAYEREVLRRY